MSLFINIVCLVVGLVLGLMFDTLQDFFDPNS